MTALVVHPAERPLVGSIPVPSDASIGHRALLFAAVAQGKSRLVSFSAVDGTLTTAACLRALGASIDSVGHDVIISGAGLGGLRAPERVVDCGASSTTMHLLCGLLATMPFRATLAGDGALSREAMTPLVTPLRRRGALVEGTGRDGEVTAPLGIEPLPDRRLLSRIEYESPAASADVKAAVLISGLRAEGATLFKEPTVSRDHTERLLDALGAPIRTFGTVVQLDPTAWDGHIAGFEFAIPGDLSAAAFLILAANLVPGSRVTARAVSVNPTRSGLLEIARDMGAGLTIEPQGERQGEPVAALHAWRAGLRAATIGGETVARANDDIPVACALAARAAGTSRVTFGDGELGAEAVRRRVAPLLGALRSFGVQCDERPGGVEIEGREGPLRAARIESGGDPSLAMTTAILALAADGPTRIEDAACIGSRYPKFVATLRALGARVDVEGESESESGCARKSPRMD